MRVLPAEIGGMKRIVILGGTGGTLLANRLRRLTSPRWRQLRSGISYCQARIDHVDVEKDRVYLQNGNALGYDVLIVATGAKLLPEETDGLTGPGRAHAIYEEAEIQRLSRLGLRPWVSAADRPFWIRIRPTSISGRRIPDLEADFGRLTR
jgi:NADH dehydrogenase FAD-containing subunit